MQPTFIISCDKRNFFLSSKQKITSSLLIITLYNTSQLLLIYKSKVDNGCEINPAANFTLYTVHTAAIQGGY